MPQISRQRLKPHIEASIQQGFYDFLQSINSKQESVGFISQLLTKTEQTMLAKRLAVIVLSQQGYSYAHIRAVVKVSQSTISSIQRNLHINANPAFNNILKKLLSQKTQKNALQTLLNTITNSPIPPKGRSWATWKKQKAKMKREAGKLKENPF